MNIVLIGFMGTGKTAVGKILAGRLGWQYIDTDELVEKKAGQSVAEVFARHGEDRFRDLEAEAVRDVSGRDKLVVACGGGAVLRKENIDALERNGIVVCLTASPEIILRRTQNSGRPLLAGGDALTKIKELLKLREPCYRRCALVIDTTGISAEEAAEKIFANPLVATQLT